MARLAKIGVDYFPHYVGSRNEKTLYILKSNFGNDGYAFWYQLLEILGSQKDLSYDCSKKANLLFLSASTNVDDEKTIEILDMLADLDAIDAELWIKDGVIWCQEFADQLEPIYKKRRQEVPTRPVLKSLRSLQAETVSERKEMIEEGSRPVEEVSSEVSLEENQPPSKTNIQDKRKDKSKSAPPNGEELTANQSYVEDEFKPPLDDWLEHRRAQGYPYRSPKSIEKCYNRLKELSKGVPSVAVDVVDYCIANNYQGLFAPNRDTVGRSASSTKKVPDCLMNANSTQKTVNRSTI